MPDHVVGDVHGAAGRTRRDRVARLSLPAAACLLHTCKRAAICMYEYLGMLFPSVLRYYEYTHEVGSYCSIRILVQLCYM